jgi:hypothetical protein
VAVHSSDFRHERISEMIVDALLDQLRENCKFTVFEMERGTLYSLMDKSLHADEWMDDSIECYFYEPPDGDSWMDDLDEAA